MQQIQPHSWLRNADIRKRDKSKQLVLGEVYVPHDPNDPETVDSQGHAATADEIQKAAHAFLAECRQECVDRDHDGVNQHGRVVESYLAKKEDPLFKQGAWVVGIHVTDNDTWNAIQRGDISGISLAGEAELVPYQQRQGELAKQKGPETSPKTPTHWLQKLRVHAISLVDKPANKRPLRVYKRDKTPQTTNTNDKNDTTAGVSPALPTPTPTLEKTHTNTDKENAENNAFRNIIREAIERQEQQTAKLAENIIGLQHQITQLTKTAGISNGERAQAREEALKSNTAKTRNTWEAITDGFGFLRHEALRKNQQQGEN